MSGGRTSGFDLGAWLTGLGLAQYSRTFTDNDVDEHVLRLLTADDLRELGVTSVGHRRRLLEAIARLGEEPAPAPPPPPAPAPPAPAAPAEAPRAERRQVTEVDRLVAHRTLGTTLLFRGEFRDAIHEFEQFLALYERDRHTPELSRTGPSTHHVVTLLGLAECYTILGEMEQAESWRAKCLAMAHAHGESHVLCHALIFAGCVVPLLTRRMEEVARSVVELNRLVAMHDLPFWHGHIDLFAGIVRAWQGRTEEGLAQARRGIEQLVAAKAYSNAWYIFYAELCLRAGNFADGAEILALAAPALEEGDAWMGAEFHRIRGLLMRAMAYDPEEARASIERAVEVAREQSAALFEAQALEALDAPTHRWVTTSG